MTTPEPRARPRPTDVSEPAELVETGRNPVTTISTTLCETCRTSVSIESLAASSGFAGSVCACAGAAQQPTITPHSASLRQCTAEDRGRVQDERTGMRYLRSKGANRRTERSDVG